MITKNLNFADNSLVVGPHGCVGMGVLILYPLNSFKMLNFGVDKIFGAGLFKVYTHKISIRPEELENSHQMGHVLLLTLHEDATWLSS